MTRLYLLAIIVTIIVLPGCGNNQEKAAEALQQAQEQIQQQTSSPMDGLKETEEVMERLKNRKPVPPVGFKVLMEFLPKEVAGLKAEKPSGETMKTADFAFSEASINFSSQDGSSSAQVQIFDYGNVYQLYAPLLVMLKMKIQHESSDGYEKAMEVAGYPAHVKWEAESKQSSCSALVGERFWVTVETTGIGENAAEKIIQAMNLKGLEGKSGY